MKFLRAQVERIEGNAIKHCRVRVEQGLVVAEDEDLEPAAWMMTRDGIGENARVGEIVPRDHSENGEAGGRRGRLRF
jgi:hypothetical protein